MKDELPLDINCLPENDKKIRKQYVLFKFKKMDCNDVTYLRSKMFGSNSKFHILKNFIIMKVT
jgi:hypothetical protein